MPFNKEGHSHAIKYLGDEYAHLDEVTGAYIINLLEMPIVTERDVTRIHQFYEKLLFNIESLETFKNRFSTRGGLPYHYKEIGAITGQNFVLPCAN